MDYVEPLSDIDLRVLRGPRDSQEYSGFRLEGVSTSSFDTSTFKVMILGRCFKFADPS